MHHACRALSYVDMLYTGVRIGSPYTAEKVSGARYFAADICTIDIIDIIDWYFLRFLAAPPYSLKINYVMRVLGSVFLEVISNALAALHFNRVLAARSLLLECEKW